jgi:hypothetical protein
MVLKCRRGQVFGFDTVFAFAVFCLIFFVIFSIAAQLTHAASWQYHEFIIQKQLYDASEALLTTPGYPRDWTPETVQRLGLADYSENRVRHHELSLEKINAMALMPKEHVRSLLVLGEYAVSISIHTRHGRILMNLGEPGDFVVKRFALCGDDECVVEISASM